MEMIKKKIRIRTGGQTGVDRAAMDFAETPSADRKHYVYILRCADGTFYTGYTTDPERRTRVHNSGKGAKYTRSRLPVELIYIEEFDDKSEAQRREYAIKQLSRAEKEKLVKWKSK